MQRALVRLGMFIQRIVNSTSTSSTQPTLYGDVKASRTLDQELPFLHGVRGDIDERVHSPVVLRAEVVDRTHLG